MAERTLLLSVVSSLPCGMADINYEVLTGRVGMLCFWFLFLGLFDQFRKTRKVGRTGIAKIDLQFLVIRWCLWAALAFSTVPIDDITYFSRVPGIPILLLLLSQEFNPTPRWQEVLWRLFLGILFVLALTAVLWILRDILISMAWYIEIVVVSSVLPFGLISTYKNYHKYVHETTEAASLLFVSVRLCAFANMAVFYGLSDRYLASALYAILSLCQLLLTTCFYRHNGKEAREDTKV